jgi:2-C-methyl-D-erythritol 2,4-cyclodiphosphate synthase
MSLAPLPYRIGFGYDIHPFAEGRPLVLGGVTIPAPRGLAGHSDADVLSHALADALLGACGLPDIGHFFPNTDPSIKGIDSQKIIRRAVAEAHSRLYRVGNVDLTLIAESPKIAPHLDAMKARLAESLGIAPAEIGLKATTNERLGSLGRNEGIAAHAVVLLLRNEAG